MISNGVSKFGIEQSREAFSVWRVIIPQGIDREVYIDRCYKTNTISGTNSNGEIYDQIKCGRLSMQLIDFPLDTDNNALGSEVLCATLPYSGEVRVIDVYATERQYIGQKENQFYFQKRNNDGSAGVLIDGAGNIILTVFGGNNQGTVLINVGDNNKTGNAEINCNGNVLFRASRIDLNPEGEPMLLGQTTVTLLSNLLDQLSQESAGPYPLLHQSNYADLKNNIDAIKSKISFVK